MRNAIRGETGCNENKLGVCLISENNFQLTCFCENKAIVFLLTSMSIAYI